jgi:hypothetical protein
MTLTPEQFKDRLDEDLLRASAGEPAMPVPGADRAAGERMLRRRRAGQAVAASLVAAAVVVTGFAVSSRVGDDHGVEVPAASIGRPPTGAQAASLLEQCSRGGANFRAATRALYGSTDPAVVVTATSGRSTWAMLRSADGSTAGTCRLDADPDAEFSVVLSAWKVGSSTLGAMSMGSFFCATPPCDQVTVEWDDQLPADVAAVRFELGDGARATVPTVDGFVLLAATVRADPPYDSADPDADNPFHQVEYLDADGKVLAAQVLDVPPDSPDAGRVGDLPLLREHPSLKGAELG